jgi:hypothetical protein
VAFRELGIREERENLEGDSRVVGPEERMTGEKKGLSGRRLRGKREPPVRTLKKEGVGWTLEENSGSPGFCKD